MRIFVIAALCLGTTSAAQDLREGQKTFDLHCAACHGTTGQGNGPMAPVLLVQPADLTQLSAKSGGVFPTHRVVKRIDGRDPLVSHGSEMPVYGWFFEGSSVAIPTGSGQPVMTSQPVAELVNWLMSIQQ